MDLMFLNSRNLEF